MFDMISFENFMFSNVSVERSSVMMSLSGTPFSTRYRFIASASERGSSSPLPPEVMKRSSFKGADKVAEPKPVDAPRYAVFETEQKYRRADKHYREKHPEQIDRAKPLVHDVITVFSKKMKKSLFCNPAVTLT